MEFGLQNQLGAMNVIRENKTNQRNAPRYPTDALITCRPFLSDDAIRSSDGVMRNFSGDGFFIETTRKLSAGIILMLRIIRFSSEWPPTAAEVGPRTICLAQVRWQRRLSVGSASRYGIGLKYLE